MRITRSIGSFVLLSIVALLIAPPAQAIRIRLWPVGVAPFSGELRGPEGDLWPGMKSVLLLPVKNEAEGGAALAKVAEAEWKDNLRASRKFSLEEIHPRSPAAIRAKNENILKDDDIQRWQQQHQLEDAFNLGTILGIQGVVELKIAGYEVVDEGKAGKSLKITLAGTLYDMKTRQKERDHPVVSSASVRIPKKNPNPTELEREALREGTKRVVWSLVGRKLAEPPKPKPAKAKAAPAKAAEAKPSDKPADDKAGAKPGESKAPTAPEAK